MSEPVKCVGNDHRWGKIAGESERDNLSALWFPCQCGQYVMVAVPADGLRRLDAPEPPSLLSRIRARAARLRRRG